ncbi:MAG: exodeoxyribonuclease VII large subunit [Acidimicrobiales bacterium]
MSLGSPRSRPRPDASAPDSLSISDLYLRIDRALKGAFPGEVWVSGEVRSFNVSSRGHCYIDLVDPLNAQDNGSPVLKVVCWSGRWSRVRGTLDHLGITLDAGLVVRVKGEVQLYKPRGDISFILSELDTEALLGRVAAERARLIKALVDENLFDRNRRLPVPRLPLRIGLVASPGTEGFRDFLGQLEASGMAFDVRVAATQVQGREAAASVAASLERLRAEQCDLLVVVRGGGSKADLATFDAEPVARAIATSDTPVWTGIGHTGDQSVADEVANRSFITPTECGQELARLATDYWRMGLEAAIVVGRLGRDQVARSERTLDRHRHGMATGARSQLDRHAERLVHRTRTLRGAVRSQVDARERQLAVAGTGLARCAVRSLASGEESLWFRTSRLAALPDRCLQVEELRAAQWRRLLGAFDYRRQLERGYSVTRDGNGRVVRSAAEVTAGELLLTRLSDGEVASRVTDEVVPAGGSGGTSTTASGSTAIRHTGVGDATGSERQQDEGMRRW